LSQINKDNKERISQLQKAMAEQVTEIENQLKKCLKD